LAKCYVISKKNCFFSEKTGLLFCVYFILPDFFYFPFRYPRKRFPLFRNLPRRKIKRRRQQRHKIPKLLKLHKFHLIRLLSELLPMKETQRLSGRERLSAKKRITVLLSQIGMSFVIRAELSKFVFRIVRNTRRQ